MEIAELGEFGLIRHLTEDIEIKNRETVKGVGDDCAVMDYGGERVVLMTTDLLLEGVHFDLQYVPLKHLGYKAAMVNLSDIYAMNGRPRQMTVSLGVSKRFSVEDLEEIYAGLRLACDSCQCDIVGGDTSASMTGLTISITVIGDAERDKVVYRSGAKENDIICVTGDLGAAYMGLQLLEREKGIYYEQSRELQQKIAEAKESGDSQKLSTLNAQLSTIATPDFTGREYLLERQLKPEARKDIIEALAAAGIVPTAMMDISDGLSSELMHICKQSNVGCRVYEERIPLDYQTAAAAEEMNLNVTTCAMNGGEDYELLFTVPLSQNDAIQAVPGVKTIGYITRAEAGQWLVCRDGTEMELKAQGWNPLKNS